MKVKTILLFVITLSLIIPQLTVGLKITEILFNPLDSEENEFIEIILDNSTDISNLVVNESGILERLIPYKLNNESNIAIIIGETANISFYGNLSCNIFITEGRIGNGLSNSQGIIEILEGNRSLRKFIYNSSMAREGKSVEIYNESIFTESMQEGGTPCQYNESIFFENNSSINETDNTENNESQICPQYFDVFTDKEFYEEGERVRLKFDFPSEIKNYKINYWVDDYFGNNVKSRRETQNKNPKSFTPRNLEKGFNIFIFKAILSVENCTDLYDESLFIVYSNKSESTENKEVKKSCDKEETVDSSDVKEMKEDLVVGEEDEKIKIKINKINSRKYVIKIYVNGEKEREVMKINSKADLENMTLYLDKESLCLLGDMIKIEGLGKSLSYNLSCQSKKEVEEKEELIGVKNNPTSREEKPQNKEILQTSQEEIKEANIQKSYMERNVKESLAGVFLFNLITFFILINFLKD